MTEGAWYGNRIEQGWDSHIKVVSAFMKRTDQHSLQIPGAIPYFFISSFTPGSRMKVGGSSSRMTFILKLYLRQDKKFGRLGRSGHELWSNRK